MSLDAIPTTDPFDTFTKTLCVGYDNVVSNDLGRTASFPRRKEGTCLTVILGCVVTSLGEGKC